MRMPWNFLGILVSRKAPFHKNIDKSPIHETITLEIYVAENVDPTGQEGSADYTPAAAEKPQHLVVPPATPGLVVEVSDANQGFRELSILVEPGSPDRTISITMFESSLTSLRWQGRYRSDR